MSVIGPSGREAGRFTGTAGVAAVIPALNEQQAIAGVVRSGYGRACLSGARHAAGADILVFLDGDGSDIPAQVPRLVCPIASRHAVVRRGPRIREVPVDYRTRNGGRSKLSADLRARAAAGWHMLGVAWRTR